MSTIRDVARLAGVGLGTASRVISGKGAVAPATAERVREAVAALGFRPSHAARALLSGSSRMVGVYIPLLSGSFYPRILQTIDAELRAADLHMVVAFGREASDTRDEVLAGAQFLIDRDCDGVIVMSNALLPDDAAELVRQQPHLVILNSAFEALADRCFMADHVEGGRLAAEALLGRGHRAIALIGGPEQSPDNRDRLRGFTARLTEAGIDAAHLPRDAADFSTGGGYAATSRLLASGAHFTALFCANDEMAVGALVCLAERGFKVPRDVSVIGYDDTLTAEFAVPRLTTVHMPVLEVTRAAVSELLNRCYGLALPVSRRDGVSVTWRASVAEFGDGGQ
jgi:LacI family transcriptional regulator